MRKLLSVLTVMLLLTAVAVPAGAADIQSGLVNFISVTYDLDQDEFKISELYQVELENLGLSLTLITWHTETQKGQAAWVAETGAYLADEEINKLMAQEWEIWTAEYARLQEEAGKMDVWLYQQLLENPDEIFEIIINPIFVLTPELETLIRELYEEFGLEAPQDLNWFVGQVNPSFRGTDLGNTSSDQSGSGVSGSVTPLPADAKTPEGGGSDPSEPAGSEPILPTPPGKHDDVTDGDKPVSSAPDRDIYQPYPDEFYAQLNELYVQGFANAISTLTAYLDSIAVEYRVEGGSIFATVTAQQALELRNHQDINWISSDGSGGEFHILPAAFAATDSVELLFRGELRTATGDLDEAASKHPWIWSGAFLGLMAAGIFFIIKK